MSKTLVAKFQEVGFHSLETVCQSERKRGMGRTYTQDLPREILSVKRTLDLEIQCNWSTNTKEKNVSRDVSHTEFDRLVRNKTQNRYTAIKNIQCRLVRNKKEPVVHAKIKLPWEMQRKHTYNSDSNMLQKKVIKWRTQTILVRR